MRLAPRRRPLPPLSVAPAAPADVSREPRHRPPIAPPPPLRRDQLGLSDDATVVVLVGRLQPWKGQNRAIQAVAALRAEKLDVQLLIVGGSAFGFDVEYAGGASRARRSLGLRDHVVMTGQVDSAHPYLAVADIALNASESEPFGIVMIEALANGIPVVAVNAAGPAEVLTDGTTGSLATDGSPEALAEALRPLVCDESVRRSLAQAGRELYRENFTAAVMSRRIAEEIVAVAR